MAVQVGDLLREAREAAGITQRQLAERAHTQQSAISRIERNQVSPTVRTLEGLLGHAGATLTVAASYDVTGSNRGRPRKGKKA